ncbi:DUF397 domain-containing protein [Streptomyces sp. AC550_RSS872]|uniref:DUF397 domain-containing protein n=1 Tax=Streptomyces sp. AC550_RSS872 TaxID=2823689 RepID=UPI001C26E023|nr:DUF397 domain-containing protein [Streptomyces sp. AC550_RSS872]
MSKLTWQKSTYSAEAANCVEIATTPTTIHIRDSKNTTGPHLTLRLTAWTDFLSHTAATQ